jgi:transcriptional regulator with XRE-family HTH domain
MHDESQDRPTPSSVFRTRLKAAREAAGLSQRDLAQRVSAHGVPMTQPAIALIEGGRPAKRGQRARGVSLDEAVTIAAVLRIPPERLYAYRVPATWEDFLVAEAEADHPDDVRWRAEQIRRSESNDDPRKES